MTSENRPECLPEIVPHRGGDPLHNLCADRVPNNGVSGFDVRVNRKNYDAVQFLARVLWEVKTDNFEKYSDELRDIVLKKQIPELRRERDLAKACGFGFRVGVRSAAHKDALRKQAPDLDIVLMDWC